MTPATTIKVTSPGTRVQATHKGNSRSLTLKARADNAGDVYIGGSDVSSTDGMTLAPGEAIEVRVPVAISTSQFWADATLANDQVDVIGAQP